MVKPVRDRQRARQLALLAALLAAEAALLSQGPIDAWQVSTTAMVRSVTPVPQLDMPVAGVSLAIFVLCILLLRRNVGKVATVHFATPLRVRKQATDTLRPRQHAYLQVARCSGSRSR